MPAENTGRPLSKPKALIFDWDGTLVDTHPVLAAAMNQTLEHFGQEPWTYDEWLAWLGPSARDAFPKVFGTQWEDARQVYLDAYQDLHLDRIQALTGAVEVLSFASEASVPCAIVSNKTGDYLRREIDHFRWNDHFVAALGAGDSAQDKPAPDPVYEVLETVGVKAGSGVWFIGDNDVDVACGRATGCTTFLLGKAYPSSNPDHRLPDLPSFHRMIAASVTG